MTDKLSKEVVRIDEGHIHYRKYHANNLIDQGQL